MVPFCILDDFDVKIPASKRMDKSNSNLFLTRNESRRIPFLKSPTQIKQPESLEGGCLENMRGKVYQAPHPTHPTPPHPTRFDLL
jgi:hypothetical protein